MGRMGLRDNSCLGGLRVLRARCEGSGMGDGGRKRVEQLTGLERGTGPERQTGLTQRAGLGWTGVALLGAVGVLFLAFSIQRIHSADFWWQLRTGQWIVQHLAVPTHDELTYT